MMDGSMFLRNFDKEKGGEQENMKVLISGTQTDKNQAHQKSTDLLQKL